MAIVHNIEWRSGDGHHDTLYNGGMVMAIIHTIEGRPSDGHCTHHRMEAL